MITETHTKNWYIVHTYSGFEERVKQNLKQRVEAMGVSDAFGDIRIPTETLVEMKKVSWPGKNEVIGTTVVVIVACFIFGFYLFIVDQGLSWLIDKLFITAGVSPA